jgi:hypothetical protein
MGHPDSFDWLKKSVPLRLKLGSNLRIYGTAEAVPLTRPEGIDA